MEPIGRRLARLVDEVSDLLPYRHAAAVEYVLVLVDHADSCAVCVHVVSELLETQTLTVVSFW
jgi:hypothetical protein